MITAPTDSFARLVERLSSASVKHRWEAYRDIDWDDPELRIDHEDPRWALAAWDPLGASGWYLDQSVRARAQLGLVRVLGLLRVGAEFEAVLQQGLLEVASQLPDGHPAFRYIHHEITEESQHSMMFQEFIVRSGVKVPRSPDEVRSLFGTIGGEAHGDWSMFFLAALTAEEVFDQIQRRFLAVSTVHPLFRRVCEIHVAEEARHLSFARAYLRDAVPRLDQEQRRLMRFRAPFVIEWMTRHILTPPVLTDAPASDREMPADVEASLRDGPAARRLRGSCARAVVGLCEQLDLVDPRLASQWSKVQLATAGPAELAG